MFLYQGPLQKIGAPGNTGPYRGTTVTLCTSMTPHDHDCHPIKPNQRFTLTAVQIEQALSCGVGLIKDVTKFVYNIILIESHVSR